MERYAELYEYLSSLVPWLLRNVLDGTYVCRVDAGGNPISFEIGPDTPAITVERMERDLDAVYGQRYEALLDLKDQRTAEQLATALEPFVGPVIAAEQSAALADADWSKIVTFVYRQAVQFASDVSRLLVKERLAVGTSLARRLEIGTESRDGLAVAALEYIVHEFKDAFPGMVARMASLRIIGAEHAAPLSTSTGLHEASTCFVHGEFLAMLMLCRSVLEYALQDRLAVSTGRSYQNQNLARMLAVAREAKLPDEILYDQSDKIRLATRNAIHRGVMPSLEQCREHFEVTRGIIQHLYESGRTA